MTPQLIIIETGIDRLFELVCQHKRISLETAAKLLKVPESLVEQWADVLENNGKVGRHDTIRHSYLVPIDSMPLYQGATYVAAEKESNEHRTENLAIKKPRIRIGIMQRIALAVAKAIKARKQKSTIKQKPIYRAKSKIRHTKLARRFAHIDSILKFTAQKNADVTEFNTQIMSTRNSLLRQTSLQEFGK